MAARICECTACGAVVEVGPHAVATRCTYCDAPAIDSAQTQHVIDAIVPFRLTKAAAQERLRSHVGDNFWAPNAIRKLAQRNQLQTDQLQGVLVPFYVYDAILRGDYAARVGVHWQRREKVRTRHKTDKAGEDIQIEGERVVQETEWFDVRGSMGTQLEDHLVCASTGLDKLEARKLEPFDLGRAVDFDPRIMLGWSAELPSRSRQSIDDDAHSTLSAVGREHLLHRHLTGNAQRLRTFELDVDVQQVRLALLPVWIAKVRLPGNVVARVLVNGQTGHSIGRLPVSKVKVALAVLGALILAGLAWWVHSHGGLA